MPEINQPFKLVLPGLYIQNSNEFTTEDLEEGDSQVSLDGAMFVNSNNDPYYDDSGQVVLDLTSSEMSAEITSVRFLDKDGIWDQADAILRNCPYKSIQQEILETINSISNSASSGAQGSGSINFPVCSTDVNGNPIQNVRNWVSTDFEGTNLVTGSLYSDEFGNVNFLLNPGSYYLWRDAPNQYNVPNPKLITVT